jgi:hypothetical protein
MTTTYTITGNASQSHIIFTGSDGSIVSLPNNNCNLRDIGNDTIRVYNALGGVLVAHFSKFSGVNIDNSSSVNLIDTIKEFYLF